MTNAKPEPLSDLFYKCKCGRLHMRHRHSVSTDRVPSLIAMEAELRTARAELVELRADKARLDYLDRPWRKIHVFGRFDWMSSKTDVHPDYKGMRLSDETLRQAIDAAMEESGDG